MYLTLLRIHTIKLVALVSNVKKINSIYLEIVEQYEYTDCVPSKWHEPYIQQELLKVKDAGVNISFLLVVGRLGVHNPLTFCVMGLRRPRLMLDD